MVEYLKLSFQWESALAKKQANSIRALAEKYGIEDRNAKRISQMRFLSPQIIDLILAGKQPPHFSLELLKKPFPMCWKQQESYFQITQ